LGPARRLALSPSSRGGGGGGVGTAQKARVASHTRSLSLPFHPNNTKEMITTRGHTMMSSGRAGGQPARPLARSLVGRTRSVDVRAIGFRFGDDDDDEANAAPSRRNDDEEALAGLAGLARRASPERGNASGADANESDGRPLPPIIPRLSQSSNLRAQSLLILGPALRTGPVGEAFSSLLATATRYQAKNSEIAREMARLYSAMLATSTPSWPDYLVDQVLAGRDNPLARAAAQGQLDFDQAPALQALKNDLDALQELSAPLQKIAAYVADVAPTVPARWVAAAGSEPSARKTTSGGGETTATNLTTIDVSARSRFVRPPPTEQELGAWRAAVQGHARWSQAVPLLQAYWHLHGFGVTSRASALRWSAGGLEEVPGAAGGAAAAIAAATAGGGATTTSPLAAMDACYLSAHASQRKTIEQNLARHAAGLPDAPARPLLLAGPPGSGKSFLLRESSLHSSAVKSGGVRVVDVGPAELSNLLEAARGCGRYPRVRFVLLADDVSLPLPGSPWASELFSALAAAGGAPATRGSASWWPANVTLHVAASASSAVGWGDPLAQRCGDVVLLPSVGEEGFLAAVKELLVAAGVEDEHGVLSGGGGDAVAWAKERGALSLRGAVSYARDLVAEAAYKRAVEEGRAG
jgi:predicted AAA+ superfamily ATPase